MSSVREEHQTGYNVNFGLFDFELNVYEFSESNCSLCSLNFGRFDFELNVYDFSESNCSLCKSVFAQMLLIPRLYLTWILKETSTELVYVSRIKL